MYLLLLILIAGIKILLCKGLALGIVLLLFWIKGRRLRFCSDEWDNFFLSLPASKVQKYTIEIYLAAAVVSSIISYFILELTGYRHSLGITILLFAGGVAVTSYKWRTKEKDYLLKRYQEIPQIIMERRERENGENE